MLGFGIPFARIPLVLFKQRRRIMGTLTNSRVTAGLAWLVSSLIVGLNLYRYPLVQTIGGAP